MNKNKEKRKIENEKLMNVQFKILGIMGLLVLAGVIMKGFDGVGFKIARFACFGGFGGLMIFLKIYTGRHKQ